VDEVLEFCRRVLVSRAGAEAVAAQAWATATDERLARLTRASRACRDRDHDSDDAAPLQDDAADAANGPVGLTEAVTRELAAANGRLTERHREALALRDLLRLSHDEIAAVMGLEVTAVAPLLARARLRLRTELRGAMPEADTPCAERDRSLELLARRQDAENVSAADEAWLLDHVGECAECERLHAAMLEAAVCYRAWPAASASGAMEAPR
jgi:hypothetical protein